MSYTLALPVALPLLYHTEAYVEASLLTEEAWAITGVYPCASRSFRVFLMNPMELSYLNSNST